jgi:hypothetical protein
MAYTLPVDMSIGVAVTYTDREGNTVDLPQGNVTWESSDETILKITVNPDDDQQARLMPGGTLGNAQVTCTGTNPSGTKVIATLDVTIVAGDAVTGTIQPQGDPQPIPPS